MYKTKASKALKSKVQRLELNGHHCNKKHKKDHAIYKISFELTHFLNMLIKYQVQQTELPWFILMSQYT